MSETRNFPGGSSPAKTTAFNLDANNVYSDSLSMPTGRVCADGDGYTLITGVRAYMAGRGASRTAYIKVGGTETSGFTISAASSAGSTGTRSLTRLVTNGGNLRVELRANGAYYFGRGNNGSTVKPGDGYVWDGALSGYVVYVEAPTSPRSLAAAPGTDTAALTWSTPSDDGGTAVTGYRLEYDTDDAFGSPTVVNLGAVTSHTVEDLTPGETYYFRLAAKNAVTAEASTWSVYSSTASAFLGGPPDAPTGVDATAGLGSAQVAWVAPVDDGGVAITGYRIEWSDDAGFAGASSREVGAAARRITITGLAPGTTYYFRVYAVNSVGESDASTSDSVAPLARTTLELVRGASVDVGGGVQVEIRSDGAATPTLTLGYIAFGTGSTFVSIATIPTGSPSSDFDAPGGRRNLALVADPEGNLFVIGRRGDDQSAVSVYRYERTASTSWSLDGELSAALENTGDSLVDFAAAWVPGTGIGARSTILLLARRAGTVGAGSLSVAVLDPAAVAASTGDLFVSSGEDPAWLSTPPVGAAFDSGLVDVSSMTSTRLAVLGNGWAVIDVVNGVVSSVSKAAAGTATAGPWGRVLALSASSFMLLRVVSGALTWSVYTAAGVAGVSGSLAAANATGSDFADGWDAYYDRAAGVVTVYYLADDGSTRKLEAVDVSPTTGAASAAVVLTAALGGSGTTNGPVRVPEGAVDERRVLVAAANNDAGTLTTTAYSDTSGNVAPSAPSVTSVAGFDASLDFAFAWVFADANTVDAQTAYDLVIQRVSDDVDVVTSGKTASASGAYTLDADTIANGQAYRWRVRTYDQLDAVGAWSPWDEFTASALGNLTITAPAADDPVGLDESTIALAWSYAQGDGYLQTQRRVRLLLDSDGSVLSDTTMQASTATSYDVLDVPTDLRVRIELSIVTDAPGTPTVGPVTRYLTTSYGLPMPPEAAITAGEAWLAIAVTNPEPSGDRPEVVRNIIERRETGSGDAFVAVGEVGYGETYLDHAVRSGVGYDYRVRGYSA